MFGLFQKRINKISMDEAKTILDTNSSIKLIDVRTRGEYAQGHINGSINIPLDMINTIESIIKDKDEMLFVHCLSGGRSKAACDILSKMGYSNITNIGGISSWKYEIVQGL